MHEANWPMGHLQEETTEKKSSIKKWKLIIHAVTLTLFCVHDILKTTLDSANDTFMHVINNT